MTWNQKGSIFHRTWHRTKNTDQAALRMTVHAVLLYSCWQEGWVGASINKLDCPLFSLLDKCSDKRKSNVNVFISGTTKTISCIIQHLTPIISLYLPFDYCIMVVFIISKSINAGWTLMLIHVLCMMDVDEQANSELTCSQNPSVTREQIKQIQQQNMLQALNQRKTGVRDAPIYNSSTP